jgi:anti-sigma B factor antagonist
MRAMHEIEEHVVDRFPAHAAPALPDLSLSADPQTAAPPWPPDIFSVRLLTAHPHDQDASVLSVQGEIDLGTAPAMREALLPVLEHQTGAVALDLSEVAFMDSTGVHVLVDTLQRLKLENRRLAIACREGDQVHRLLGLVGLLDTVAVYGSRESALAGGDDLLRSEPGGISSRSTAQALTLSRPPNSPASAEAPQAK